MARMPPTRPLIRQISSNMVTMIHGMECAAQWQIGARQTWAAPPVLITKLPQLIPRNGYKVYNGSVMAFGRIISLAELKFKRDATQQVQIHLDPAQLPCSTVIPGSWQRVCTAYRLRLILRPSHITRRVTALPVSMQITSPFRRMPNTNRKPGK